MLSWGKKPVVCFCYRETKTPNCTVAGNVLFLLAFFTNILAVKSIAQLTAERKRKTTVVFLNSKREKKKKKKNAREVSSCALRASDLRGDSGWVQYEWHKYNGAKLLSGTLFRQVNLLCSCWWQMLTDAPSPEWILTLKSGRLKWSIKEVF